MTLRSFALFAVIACGCTNVGITHMQGDLASSASDGALPPDLVSTDSDAGPDLASATDLSGEADLATLPDFAVVPDIAELPDLATPLDFAVPSDFAVPPDFAIPPDFVIPLDFAVPPDFTMLPDLVATGCTSDSQCASPTPRCDRNTGNCVQCLPTNDNCPFGAHCAVNGQSYACAAGCLGNQNCNSGNMCCNGTCADLNTNLSNCGTCGRVCSSLSNATTICSSGNCLIGQCAANYADCNGVASDGCEVSLLSNVNNCGYCGHVCSGGQMCVNGTCATACSGGTLRVCNSQCVDIATDFNNCGACSNRCVTGSTCTSGTCQCASGQTACASGCTNVLTDRNNCGGCNKACAANSICQNGQCYSCNTGFSACGNACVMLSADPTNCGTCGRTCGAFQCSTSSCTTKPLNGCIGAANCVNACTDSLCDYACVANTTLGGYAILISFYNCLDAACPPMNGGVCDKSSAGYNATNCSNCYNAAQNVGGACYTQLVNCYNSTP